MFGNRLCCDTIVIWLKAKFGKNFSYYDSYRFIKTRGYNPYSVKLLALALFIAPLLNEGGTAFLDDEALSFLDCKPMY